MKNGKQLTGKKGENEACAYLSQLGHTIIARNWRSSHLELDIVSFIGGEIHFIEVKSRTAPVTADPLVNITAAKRKNVARAAAAFLHSADKKMLPPDMDVCFDVITVILAPGGEVLEIEYYPKAFTPIYV